MAMPLWLRWSLGGLVGLVLVVALLAGIGLSLLSSGISPDVEIGAPLPAVRLTALDGTPLDLRGYQGQVVVLDFWNSW